MHTMYACMCMSVGMFVFYPKRGGIIHETPICMRICVQLQWHPNSALAKELKNFVAGYVGFLPLSEISHAFYFASSMDVRYEGLARRPFVYYVPVSYTHLDVYKRQG